MKEEAERARQIEPNESDGQSDDAYDDDAANESVNLSAELDPRSLPAKPVWQRMIIMSAGVFMNVVTGALFAAIAYHYGVPYTPAVIGGVTPGGPAWQAGIEPGGQVVSVDGMDDSQMHFREMRSAILHAGLETPDRPIPITVGYASSEKAYDLVTQPHPLQKRFRMIGITSPTSLTLSDKDHSVPKSAAQSVLTDADLGASIVSFDGNPINDDVMVPSIPFLNYLYTHPTEPIQLGLRRVDGSKHTVELPPQKSNWVGIRTPVGPVVALVKNGPAENAGLQVGDKIQSVEGLASLDAENFLTTLAQRKPVKLSVRRGSEDLEIEISPDSTPQTLPPTEGVGDRASINAYGFAFDVPAKVVLFNRENLVEGEPLEPTDTLKKITLLPTNQFSDEFKTGRLAELIEELAKGWEFSDTKTASGFFESIQVLPAGTRFRVTAARSESDVIIEPIVQLTPDERYRFERGLGLLPSESIQTASSFREAAVLGIRECRRRLGEVFRFLKMAVRGQIASDQVGGPIRIFQVAGMEAERGISTQLLFLTMLSMNLAVLNFLPIPVLDGGHMVFLICEAIMGRRVNEELEMRLTLVGGLMLLALMVFVFFNDIIHI
jgi:regulator of sigma E protease